MTKEYFEKQLLSDLLTGKVEKSVYDYIRENLDILQEHKGYFRQYFLNNPKYAYCYALCVDECPRDDTRQEACKDPYYAYWYARDLDNCPREDTFSAVKGTEYEEDYLRNIEKPD